MICFFTKKKIVFFFIAFFAICNCSFASIINEDGDNLFVKGVRVEGLSVDDIKTTKDNALINAKQKAFDEAVKYMKYEDIQIDPVNIDACISSFSIIDEYYSKEFYSMIANFSFNKDILKSVAKKSLRNGKKGGGDVVDLVVELKEKNDIVAEYVVFKNFLKKEKISFYPVKITATKVSVLLKKVVEDEIYFKLKDLDLNGSIYVD